MTPAEAEKLAARTLTAIDSEDSRDAMSDWFDADRERVASDLAGLRHHSAGADPARCADDQRPLPCPDARRYADGLRRTAALYGVEL